MLGSNFVFQLVNLSSCKASCKQKELQILLWKYFIWLFLGQNLKKLLSCLTEASLVCQNEIFVAKKRFLNVGPKLSHLGIFGLELEKATVLWYFTSAPSNVSKHKISTKNKNP